MKFDGWQESKGCNICNDKPIHDWIRFRKGEPGDRRSPQSTSSMCAYPRRYEIRRLARI